LTKPTSLFIQRTSLFKSINGVERIFKSVGLDPFALDADAIMAKAGVNNQFSEYNDFLVKKLKFLRNDL